MILNGFDTTKNYQLYVTDQETTPFRDWWRSMGYPSDSNMTKIDEVLSQKMDVSVYDPQGRNTDIFKYVDDKIASVGTSSGGSSDVSYPPVIDGGTPDGPSYEGIGKHEDIGGRDDPDQHPIDAITDLRDELNKRLKIDDPDHLLGNPDDGYTMTITPDMIIGGGDGSGGTTQTVEKLSDLEQDIDYKTGIEVYQMILDMLKNYSPSGGSCTHPKTDELDFSEWDDGVMSEKLDNNTTEIYDIEFDSYGRPVCFTQRSNQHSMKIIWTR